MTEAPLFSRPGINRGSRPRIGLAFLPMAATTITGSVLGANVLLTRIGPRLTLPLGMLAGAAGLAWLTRLTVTSSYPAAVLGPLLTLGLGLGLIFAPAISLGTARLRGQDTGVGSALVSTTQQAGGAVGITLLYRPGRPDPADLATMPA